MKYILAFNFLLIESRFITSTNDVPPPWYCHKILFTSFPILSKTWNIPPQNTKYIKISSYFMSRLSNNTQRICHESFQNYSTQKVWQNLNSHSWSWTLPMHCIDNVLFAVLWLNTVFISVLLLFVGSSVRSIIIHTSWWLLFTV